jgi:tetratricopeptide (TPR) repeat protein
MSARGLYGILVALGVLFTVSFLAFAASPTDRQDCAGNVDKPDLRIAACTHVIDDASETTANHVAAYISRGAAYLNKKDYDPAIADYSAAIKLDPKSSTAYNGRGNVYFAKVDFDLAIAD